MGLTLLFRKPSASLWLQAAGCERLDESDSNLAFKVVVSQLPVAFSLYDVRSKLDD